MITMKDTCQLAETTSDGYGDVEITGTVEIDCLFLQNSGYSRSNNSAITESDAHVYLDTENPALISRGYRIEGMYLLINPFGAPDDDSWYKISRVVVGQQKLTTNAVDNVHAFLQKVAKP